MAISALFPTLVCRRSLVDRNWPRFNRFLTDECHALAASDDAGRRWSAQHYLGGYTSYGSLDCLHRVSSLFDRLRRKIEPHVKSYARDLHYDLRGRTLAMTDCWVNVMPDGTFHSMHLHPTSFISGVYYVAVPKGAGGVKFEDPRLSHHMAAPPRRNDAPKSFRPFAKFPAKDGDLILFESWLRHEVVPARFSGERISVSFNYAWTSTTGR